VIIVAGRVTWRKDSFLDDGQDRGLDLVGGYFDGQFEMSYHSDVQSVAGS
jgi:hypothetical protein